jgi:hypothetical protein
MGGGDFDLAALSLNNNFTPCRLDLILDIQVETHTCIYENKTEISPENLFL